MTQTNRLTGGQIDRSQTLKFSFDGKQLQTVEIERYASSRRLCVLDTNGCLLLTEDGQLVVKVNNDSSQVVTLPGVTNISDLVFEDPCAFWVLNCTNPEEGSSLWSRL